jgi:hypothetical protein
MAATVRPRYSRPLSFPIAVLFQNRKSDTCIVSDLKIRWNNPRVVLPQIPSVPEISSGHVVRYRWQVIQMS